MLQLVPPEGLTLFIERVFGKFHPLFPDAREFALRHRVLLIRSKNGIPTDISASPDMRKRRCNER